MSARPRGFIERWVPRAETRVLLDQVNQVLAEYLNLLPLTLRQIFYRLVGAYGYEKTEQASKRLGETLNKARRAGLVDMDAIRDDGFTSAAPVFFDGVDDFLATVADWAQNLRFDRQAGQRRRLALWCEAAGMVPQLERVAAPFGVGVYSSGGFDSLTDKHRIGREWSDAPITLLHLGDHDPSGVHCFSALEADVVAFAGHYGGDIEFVRLAVTPEQARQYGLPSAPPKATDRRSFDGNETWQLEALDPHDLANIVRGAIETRLDRALSDRVVAEEREARPARQCRCTNKTPARSMRNRRALQERCALTERCPRNDRKRVTAAPWQASPSSSYHPLHHRQWTRGMASDCFGIVFRKVKVFRPFSNDVAADLS